VEDITVDLADLPAPIDAGGADIVDTDTDDDVDDVGPRTKIGRQLEVVANRPILPPPGHAKAVTKRIARDVGRSTAWAALHPHQLLAQELRPIARGIAVTWRAWRRWETEADFAAIVATTPSSAPGHEAH